MKGFSHVLAISLCLGACQKSKTVAKAPEVNGTAAGAGDDKDGDGVLDDVQLYLDSLHLKGPLDQSMKQYARAFKSILEARSENEALEAGKQLVDAIQCIYVTVPDLDRADELKADLQGRILNSEARLATYYRVSQLLSGHSFEHRPLEDKVNACVQR